MDALYEYMPLIYTVIIGIGVFNALALATPTVIVLTTATTGHHDRPN
mgnify:CR=1 FL=1